MSKKIIINLLNYALQEKAQYLAISRQEDQISLDCYLPDGELRHLSLPKKLEQKFFEALNQVLSIGTGDLINKKYHKIPHKNSHLPVYLTVLPAKNNEKVIIDLIKRPQEFWRLNQLGLQTKDLKEVKKILNKRSGLIIVSSPHGGGKSTTLQALMSEINNPAVNIYFLGTNPINPIPGVNILNPTLKNWEKIKQHDSEIIFIDNLDQDWALSEALLTASTGRLVIIALSANNSSELITRIKGLKITPRLIKENLKMIINQKLVPLNRPPNKPFNTKLTSKTKSNISAKSRAGKRHIIGKFDIVKL